MPNACRNAPAKQLHKILYLGQVIINNGCVPDLTICLLVVIQTGVNWFSLKLMFSTFNNDFDAQHSFKVQIIYM